MDRAGDTVAAGVPCNTGSCVVPSLSEILAADPDQFVAQYTDIAAVNLACARGLPKADEGEFTKYIARLDTIAASVQAFTQRSIRVFKVKAKDFNHSENVFRCLTMEHVIRVQFGIKYDPIVAEAQRTGGRRDLGDSTEVFIHGALGPKKTGTCSSLPTFTIAIGRRLGYPLKLVRSPKHTFYRWDDGKEIFNIQHTDAGGEVVPDQYFRERPHKWDELDHQMNERTKVWLHSLTPRQEVSKFLCNRAIVLRDIGRFAEALKALEAAERFDGKNPAITDIWHSVEYGMAGGNVRALVDGDSPHYFGGLHMFPIPDPTQIVMSLPNQPEQPGPSSWSVGNTVNCLTQSLQQPSRKEYRPAIPQRTSEEADFTREHRRLVRLINESNRSRSPQHPNGNPPTDPLLRQLTQLLLSQHSATREGA